MILLTAGMGKSPEAADIQKMFKWATPAGGNLENLREVGRMLSLEANNVGQSEGIPEQKEQSLQKLKCCTSKWALRAFRIGEFWEKGMVCSWDGSGGGFKVIASGGG